MGRSSAHTSTKVKMLTPFSLRSRHGDVTTLSSLIPGSQQQQDQAPRRRSGSERYLPVSTLAAAAEIHGHRGSDGSPRISLPARTTETSSSDHTAVTDDVTDSRVQGVIASSARPGQSSTEASADMRSSDGGLGTTTITTKSSQDLNSRLAASLSRWNARHATSDEFKPITTKNSSDLDAQVRQVAVTDDVTDVRAPGVITSLPRDSQPKTNSSDLSGQLRHTAVISDVTDSRLPEVKTSSDRVGQSTTETSMTVQASGTRSTPAVQPSTSSPRTQASTQPHSASMSDMLNVEAKTSDDRRPRSTIYGEIRDRVFGSKQSLVGGKPSSPFSMFEPPRDETGKKGSSDFTGSKHAAVVVPEVTSGRAPAKLPHIQDAVSDTSQTLASKARVTAPAVTSSVDEGFSSSRSQMKDDLPKMETKSSVSATQVLSTSPVSSTISRSSLVVDSGDASAPGQLPGQPSLSPAIQVHQQSSVTTADMSDSPQLKSQETRQVSTGVGRALTTRAEVPPSTQAHPVTSSQRTLDTDIPTKVEMPPGKGRIQQIGAVLPSRTTAAETVSTSRSTEHRAPPAVSTSSVQTTRGKIVPSPTSRVDWAKQRFGAAQSADVIPDSSPKMKHRIFSVPHPGTDVDQERVLSNLDESISKLATAAVTRVVSPMTSAQEQPPSSQMTFSSAAVQPTSSAVHSPPPFKPLTVSPPITISSRIAIVHGLQMSPPASTTASRTATEHGGSAWSPALTVQPSAAGFHPNSSIADVKFATRSDTGSGFQSTTSIVTTSTPSDWRSSGKPVQPVVSASTLQRTSPAVVSSNASTGSAVQFNVPPTSVLPIPATAAAPSGVSSMVSVSRSQPPISVSTATSPPPQIQRTTPMFSVQKPVVSPVLARPALPTITARVWQPQLPQIQLSAQPLKPVLVRQSPVPENKLVLVSPQKSVPDTTIPTSSSFHVEDTAALYSAPTARQEPLISRTSLTGRSNVSSEASRQVSVPQTQVSTAAYRTQVEVTQNRVQGPAQSSQIGVQQVQAHAQSSQAGISQVQSPRPVQPGHVVLQQIQATTSNNIPRVETRGQAQPATLQTETKSIGVASGVSALTSKSVGAPRDHTSEVAGGTRTRQGERPGAGTAAVPDRQLIISSGQRGQIEQQRESKPTIQVSDRQLTISSSVAGRGDQQRRGGTAAVDDEVHRALRVLDSIAAETRSLSTSLSRTTTMTTSTTSSPLRVQTSQPSTAVVVGSPRDSAAASDQKSRQPKSPRGETTHLKSAGSLDSSGVIKKHLVHLESIFRPGASDPHVKKSVSLRKPRPLRKAQTVDLTAVGIGVDPELMQLLRTRKEKSASDDEDSAAKPRDDVVSSTSRYCAVVESICTYVLRCTPLSVIVVLCY